MQLCDFMDELDKHVDENSNPVVLVVATGGVRLGIALAMGTRDPQDTHGIVAEEVVDPEMHGEELLEKFDGCCTFTDVMVTIDGKDYPISSVDFEEGRILIHADMPEPAVKTYTFFGFYQDTDEPWCDSGEGKDVQSAMENAVAQYHGDLWVVGCVEGNHQEVSEFKKIQCAGDYNEDHEEEDDSEDSTE